MARKPTDFGPVVDAQIELRASRGESALTIAHALGIPNQHRTIARRIERLKGKTPAGAKPASTPKLRTVTPNETPAADVPDEVPPDTTADQLDRWIKRLEDGARQAEANKNLAALASIAAKVATLMALKHRSQPIPKPDPNDNPDFRSLAKQGEKRLLALLHDVFPSQ